MRYRIFGETDSWVKNARILWTQDDRVGRGSWRRLGLKHRIFDVLVRYGEEWSSSERCSVRTAMG